MKQSIRQKLALLLLLLMVTAASLGSSADVQECTDENYCNTDQSAGAVTTHSNLVASDLPENTEQVLSSGSGQTSQSRVLSQSFTVQPTNVCGYEQQAAQPFVVTVDGLLLETGLPYSTADVQHCVDVALAAANIQMQFDRLQLAPALNVSAVVETQGTAPLVRFQGYSNYSHFISKAEIRIFNVDQSVQGQPVAVLALDSSYAAQWRPPIYLKMPLQYRLRVYDSNNRFDETLSFGLDINRAMTTDEDVRQALLAGYGKSHLTLQNIAVKGGTLTISGSQRAADEQVYFLGSQIPVNEQGQFVAQQIMPAGQHNVEVAIINNHGDGQLYQRQLQLDANDWFYVGMAELTVGRNSVTGPGQLVTQDEQQFSEDLFVDGRLAFYTKGTLQDKYTVTASVDSREEAIDDIFSNLSRKDPRSLLRRLEEENNYAVYGDDSTVFEDAPTQGRFYARIEDDKSSVTWGNFITAIQATEFARIERGLYGLNLDWNSSKQTSFGDRQTQATVFAAESDTNAAYEEFRGTGGSLYYLHNQDITQGSERVSVEVRDKDSNLVLSSTPMAPGQDYEVDALQGRILLTSPLSSISNDGQLVRNGGVSGHQVYLTVNYEYTPGFDQLDAMSVGGRFSHWLNNKMQLGTTLSNQEMGQQDHQLAGVDLTYRLTDESYIKLEVAQTKGQGVASRATNNGGFHFSDLTSPIVADDSANAFRLESGILLSDLDIGSAGRGSYYWQTRDAGFSGLSQFSQYDTDQIGAQLALPIGQASELNLKIDSREENGGIDEFSAEIDLEHQLNDTWKLSGGVRKEDSEAATVVQSENTGARTDAVIQLDYQNVETWGLLGFVQGTLQHDETRLANNRLGVGGHYQINDKLTLTSEVSGGNQGIGALLGTDYKYSDSSNVYLNYALDPDRTDNGLGGRIGQLVGGVRHRFTDSVSVYGEERYQHGEDRTGLVHAYGVEYSPTEQWLTAISYENGSQAEPGKESLQRNAIALSANYATDKVKYGVALEYRKDQQTAEERKSYLLRNNFSYQVNPDWRAQLRVDHAISDASTADANNSAYSEALLGFAYRPVNHDRLNTLFTYNYLYDLAPAEQFSSSGRQNTYQQRSHVVAVDADYDLSRRWTVGAKFARRTGELRQGREQGEWFDNTTSLYIARLDWHIVRNWDLLVEARLLDVEEAQDQRQGFLATIHRHVGNNLKVGVGYNFTDFSDDLTRLDYDAKGWFFNFVGKF